MWFKLLLNADFPMYSGPDWTIFLFRRMRSSSYVPIRNNDVQRFSNLFGPGEPGIAILNLKKMSNHDDDHRFKFYDF